MYWHDSGLIIGDLKRRKNLVIPNRDKTEDIKLPELDKKAIYQKLSLHYKIIQLSHFFLWCSNSYTNRGNKLCY